jgi:hypothetical protein
MTDQPKKPKKPRRPDADVLADYERLAARIKWKHVRNGVSMLKSARALIEEANAACGESSSSAHMGKLRELVAKMNETIEAIEGEIPPEAR